MVDKGKKRGGNPDLSTDVEIAGALPVLPLRNSVMFPHAILPLDIKRAQTRAAVARLGEMGVIAIVTQRDEADDTRDPLLFDVGCAARILKTIPLAADNIAVIVQGLQRIRILDVDRSGEFFVARVEAIAEPDAGGDEILRGKTDAVRAEAKRLIALMPELPKEANALIEELAHPGQLADALASNFNFAASERQRVLETIPLAERVDLVLAQVQRAVRSRAV